MRSAKLILPILSCAAFALNAADDFWTTKPFSQWSNAETAKMLSDSPWAQHVTLGNVAMAGATTSSLGVTSVGRNPTMQEMGQSEHPHLTYTAQIRSAMPLRQAVVRERQLRAGYDAMSAGDKAALDAKTNAYLEQPQDDIVIYVTYTSTIGNYVEQARRFWSLQNYDLVKNKVFLTIGRERMGPVGYAATNGAFQFNFPRPAAIPADGSVSLEFTHPQVGALGSERVVLEFKLSKMLIQGAPAI